MQLSVAERPVPMFRLPEAGNRLTSRLHRSPDRSLLEWLWDSLPGGAVSTPFQTPALLAAMADHVLAAQGAELRVLEIRDGDTDVPVMLVPLAVFRRGPVRMGGIPDFGLVDQCAPVLAGEAELDASLSDLLWGFIEDALGDVDLIDVKKVPPRVAGRSNPLHALPNERPQDPIYALDLTEAGEALGWRRKHVYKEARGKYRKLQAEGLQFVEVVEDHDRRHVMQVLRMQRSQRFEEKQWYNTLEEDPAQAAFIDNLLQEGGPQRPLRLFALKDDSRIAGVICALAEGTALSAMLISMGGEEWRRFSPGLLLFAGLINWAGENGFTELCFGSGVQFYKTRFGGEPWQVHAYAKPLTAAGNAYLALRRLKAIARRLRDDTARLSAPVATAPGI